MIRKHIENICSGLGHARRRVLGERIAASSRRSRSNMSNRNMRVESLEPRRLMAADPIHIGVVFIETDYLESDVGSDSQGDLFVVSFTGGAPGTRLTELRINTDKDSDGLSIGDLIFDTKAGGLGKGGYHPFKLAPGQSHSVVAEVEDGSQELVLRPENFYSGDQLVFTIDVDEVLRLHPDLSEFNKRLDTIVSGQEFQDSILEAKFDAPDYYEAAVDALFVNDYGDPQAEYGLNLPPDEGSDALSLPNRSAAAVGVVKQTPRPASIGGFVYRDDNNSGTKDAGEVGIPGVRVRLEPIDTIAPQAPLTVVTRADGSYQFNGVMPGRYRVVEVDQPADYDDGTDAAGTVAGRVVGVAVNPGDEIRNVVLGGGDAGVNYNFGELPLGSIGGYVYLAAPGEDCYGTHDGKGSLPIANVEVRLVNETGKTVATTRTGNDGSYRFNDLHAGVYSVVEVTPAGLLDGGSHPGSIRTLTSKILVSIGESVDAGRIGKIELPAGGKGEEYNFCEAAPGSLAGQVYHDRDNDGQRDPGEEAIPGVTLTLVGSNGTVVATTTTGAQGQYRFDNLAPDSYRILESQPTGFIDGKDRIGTIAGKPVGRLGSDDDSFIDVVLRQGLHGVNYDFGERQVASLSGRVHVDLNENCELDPGEQTLAGVTIELKDASGKTIATTKTNQQGMYRFDNLLPGTYSVVEHQPSGYFEGSATPGSVGGVASGTNRIDQISLGSGENAVDYDFCERPPAEISGVVYVDRNADCIRDPGEEGLAGVLIELVDRSGKVVATTTTNAQGEYSFTNLRAGEYVVRETQPEGYFQGGQVAGSHGGNDSLVDRISQIPVGWGEVLTNYNFCELLPAEISGVVYVDRNADCVRDVGEEGLAGVLIELIDRSGKVVASTTTDANGEYSFTNLRAGEYQIRETQPSGYYHGGQVAGSHGGNDLVADRISQIPISWGDTLTNYNFCEVLPAGISGVVYVDRNADCVRDSDEEGLAGVLIELIDSSGNVVATTTTNANGEYSFTNLQAGTYQVRETQPSGYYQGGQVAGSHGGNDSVSDLISEIPIGWGDSLTDYNFCEVLPAEISGVVYVDRNADCVRDIGEEGLAGVLIELIDSSGKVVATTTTDANGEYSFTNLRAGEYQIRETQPAGYFQGGQVAGSHGGNDSVPDLISQIPVFWGQSLTNYNFCEQLPAEIAGVVYVDTNSNCVQDPGEIGLAGVLIELFDEGGRLVSSTTTASDGSYRFANLPRGVYTIRETQPEGYYQGGQVAGSGGGDDSVEDVISNIVLPAGARLTRYDFCERLPATLSGKVWSNLDMNQEFDDNELPISGVLIELSDETGKVVATTRTDAEGCYEFTDLAPGRYQVKEYQPEGYFHGGQVVGTAGGRILQFDVIGEIDLEAGQHAENYNFPELPPVTISGYVFQDGDALELDTPPDPASLRDYRDGVLKPGDIRLENVTVELRDVLGVPIDPAVDQLGGSDAGVLRVTTDANGYYEFVGLRPRIVYSLYQIQPEGYTDSLDTAGTTGGLAINAADFPEPGTLNAFLQKLAPGGDPQFDAIFNIQVNPGQTSENNNFSEILIVSPPVVPPWTYDKPETPERPLTPIETFEPVIRPQAFGEPRDIAPPMFADDEWAVSWHLSVINGGFPRGQGAGVDSAWMTSHDGRLQIQQATFKNSHTDKDQADRIGKLADELLEVNLSDGRWQVLLSSTGELSESTDRGKLQMGHPDATALTGDFDGDGVDEMVLFLNGQWFVDMNGNGIFDAGDLWIRMGTALDRPVVGDWDGDGKDDVAIFGRRWQNDEQRIRKDPGLPASSNHRRRTLRREDLVRRESSEQEKQQRVLMRGQDGELLADAVDHVFQYGEQADTPIAGDWSGDGIDQIGVFRNGQWRLDEDGDGRWTGKDRTFSFGRPGDEPIVGDFNGNGIDQIGVVRGDMWIIDSDGDRQLTENDLHFRVPRPAGNSQPIVGDFDGDGIDDPGYYQAGQR